MGVLDIYNPHEKALEEIFTRTLVLYRTTSQSFQDLPNECLQLSEDLRDRKMSAKLQMKAIRAYPRAELFEFESEEALAGYFETASIAKIKYLLKEAEEAIRSWEYVTLKNWAAEAKYKIARYEEKRRRKEAIQNHRQKLINELPII